MNNSNSVSATASASAAAAASEIMMSPVNEYATEAELQKAFLQRTNSDPDGRGYTSIPSSIDVATPSAAPNSSHPPHARRRLNSTGDDTPFDLTEDIFHPLDQIRKRKQKWKRELSECSVFCIMSRLKACVPAITWMRDYKPSTDLLPDLLAGLMLTVVIIPQGMAYAILAGLDPIYGLYACLTPALIYAFFGCSKSMHIGPFALVSLLVANAVQQLLPVNATAAFARDVSFVLSILVGIFLMLMSFLRLGFAVSFLADCVLSAYTCAAAVLIMTSQWKSFLGLTGMPTGLSFVESYVFIFGHLSDINWASVMLGFGSVALLIILDEINAKYKFRIPIPSQLLTVLLGILIVFAGKLDEKFHVKVVGHIPSGLPAPHIPGIGSYLDTTTAVSNSTSTVSDQPQLQLWTFANLKAFIQPAATIALIAYIISISIAKNFAMKESEKYNAEREKKEAAANALAASNESSSSHTVTVKPTAASTTLVASPPPSFEIDPNQELFALGLANFIGGFMQCYPAAGSLSRSALVYNSGVKSPLHNVISVILLIFVLLLLTPLLYYLPNAVLAAIVFTALKSLLLQVEEGVRLYHVRKQDFLMWVCTFIATLFFDTQVGIAIGLLVSLLMLLKQTSRPPVAILGRLEHTDLYRNIQRFPYAITFRQILIFRFDAPLHFANKDFFKSELQRAIHKSEQREFMLAQPLDEPVEHASLEEQKPQQRGNNRSGSNLQKRFTRGLGKVSDSARKIARKLAKITVVGRGGHHQQSRMHEAANLDESVTPALSPPAFTTPPPAPSLPVSPQKQAVAFLEQQADLEERKQQQQPEEFSPSSPEMSRTPSPSFSPLAEPTSINSSFPSVTRSECRVQWVVLDCGSLIDIDDSALKMLLALPQQLNVTLVFCALKAPVRDLLSRTHFFDKRTPDAAVSNTHATSKKPSIERPFVTVHQAVKSLLKEQQALLSLSQHTICEFPSTSMGDSQNPFQSPPSPSMASSSNQSSILELSNALAANESNPFETAPTTTSATYPPDSYLLINLPSEVNAQLRVPLTESTNVLELVQAVETRTGKQSSEWKLDFLGVDLLQRFPLSTQLKAIGVVPGSALSLSFNK